MCLPFTPSGQLKHKWHWSELSARSYYLFRPLMKKKRVTQSLLNNKKRLTWVQWKGKLKEIWNARTVFCLLHQQKQFKKTERKIHCWNRELVNISSFFFMLLSVYWLNYIIQTINFHSLKKKQAFCPLGDAIRPKAKQTEIRAAGFIHHPRCSQGCQKEMQRKQPWIWLNKQQAKSVFLFFNMRTRKHT